MGCTLSKTASGRTLTSAHDRTQLTWPDGFYVNYGHFYLQRVLTMRAFIFALTASVLLVSCGQNGASMDMYVVANSQNAGHFINVLASLAQKHGLKPSVGQATDDRGRTLHVLEAKGRWMRLWSQNMPLRGQDCGLSDEIDIDPGQYIISVNPSLPFLDNRSSVEVAAELRQDLRQLGYQVLDRPLICNPLAKSGAAS